MAILIGCSKSQQIDFEEGRLEEVFRKAKSQNKKVFILVTDSKCGNCTSFEEHINSSKETVRILKSDYICYKADFRTASGHEMVEILKCPSYPFPYFFQNTGKLISFGFPNDPTFEISNLNKIYVSERSFAEVFRLPISTMQYKSLISLVVQSRLMIEEKQEMSTSLLLQSLKIAPYPYTIKLLQDLHEKGYKNLSKILSTINYAPSYLDNYIYGDLLSYTKVKNLSAKEQGRLNYIFLENSKNLGNLKKGKGYSFSFKIKNISAHPIQIDEVRHPCDCIKLKWSRKMVKCNDVTLVEGIFTPYEEGEFVKEIFVHSNSSVRPGIFRISGVVY
ncbi:DUF1573 domain-containing protein [Desertivirga arenae]|uniref:DUF1573 domain-containing protein n=1 Tax=Desertivirga arenae TaxID=2810309 RepID=UPI001A9586F0|nr:DUF1573 domain-containing protein [Pedobacter sp. SYSU D00823]